MTIQVTRRFRTASAEDIPSLAAIRRAVHENLLRSTITQKMYRDALTTHGQGWVCEVGEKLVGFAIAMRDGSIWALFVLPGFESQGIGRELLSRAMGWLQAEGPRSVWLCTEPGTRAESLYRRLGWRPTGEMPNGDVRYEFCTD